VNNCDLLLACYLAIDGVVGDQFVVVAFYLKS